MCPTDSRKRPDQRLLEEGDVDAASDEKYRLEEKQRAARRLRESRKEKWKPRYVGRRREEGRGEVRRLGGEEGRTGGGEGIRGRGRKVMGLGGEEGRTGGEGRRKDGGR